jgi:[acyl-carrier-protein] S-malonyltransferase
MRYAVLFPGQGSQSVGMGADVFAARPDLLGPATDDLLGWSLGELVAGGPDAELTRTSKAQPALYGVAYALWEAFADQAPHPPEAAAGHSLGEYTALAAAGTMSFSTGLSLVAARGTAMEGAAEATSSGMAALIGVDPSAAEAIAAGRRDSGGELWVANLNAPGQIVVAGSATDIEWLTEQGRELGVRRVIPLNVAGAFHTPIMAPAAADLEVALSGVTFTAPQFDVYANVTARPVADIRRSLAEQLTAPVRFAESLQAMADAGIEAFVHIGPGDVTAGMAKRSVRGATVHTVSSLEDVAAAATALAVQ